jgi:hypothetical protein
VKRGDFVRITYREQVKRAMVMLVSPNGRSLMLGFDGLLYVREGDDVGAYCGFMPVLQDEGGVYRDLLNGEALTIQAEQ